MAQSRYEEKKTADTNIYIWKNIMQVLSHASFIFGIILLELSQKCFEHVRIIANLSSFSEHFG